MGIDLVIVWPKIPDSARECDTLVKLVPTETPMQIAAPELLYPSKTGAH